MATLMVKNARLSFPSLFQHAQYKGESLEKYECTLLVEKETPMAEQIQKAIKEAGTESLGKDWSKAKLCLQDGDDKDYDGYANMWALKATTKKRPLVIDRDKSPLTEDDNVIFAGCYVNAKISIYAYRNQNGDFVAAQLEAVQFAKEGEAFGGGAGASIDDFDDISGDADDDDGVPF